MYSLFAAVATSKWDFLRCDRAEGGGNYPNGASGTFYRLNTGLAPFVSLQFPFGIEGTSLGIFGQGFSGATAVAFDGTPASFTVVSDTYLTAIIPASAKGYVTVTEGSGTLKSTIKFTPKK
jgi:IPT/TIG domain